MSDPAAVDLEAIKNRIRPGSQAPWGMPADYDDAVLLIAAVEALRVEGDMLVSRVFEAEDRAETAEAQRDTLAAALKKLLIVLGEGTQKGRPIDTMDTAGMRYIDDARAALDALKEPVKPR